MNIRKGDIVFATNSIHTDMHRYGLVDNVEDDKVWAMWSRTLEDVKNKTYNHRTLLWTDLKWVEVVKKASLKAIIEGQSDACSNTIPTKTKAL